MTPIDKKVKIMDSPDLKPNAQFVMDPNIEIMLKEVEPIKQGDQIAIVVNSFLVHYPTYEVWEGGKMMMLKPVIPGNLKIKEEDIHTLDQMQILNRIQNQTWRFFLSLKTKCFN